MYPTEDLNCIPNCEKGMYFNVDTKLCTTCNLDKPYVSKDKITCYEKCPGKNAYYHLDGYCEVCTIPNILNINSLTCDTECTSDYNFHQSIFICENCNSNNKYYDQVLNSCITTCLKDYYSHDKLGCIKEGKIVYNNQILDECPEKLLYNAITKQYEECTEKY